MNASHYAPTNDATLRGVCISGSVYAAHLELLALFRRGGVRAVDVDLEARARSDAWIALEQSGIIAVTEHARQSGPEMHWVRYHLTAYGRVYAGQRGISIA
jgi:hypothetical protein